VIIWLAVSNVVMMTNPAGSLINLKKPVILAAVIMMYWIVGYYPIHPVPKFNNESVLQTDDSLQFTAPGIAYTWSAPDWLDDAITNSSFDISLDVQPSAIEQTGPARILSISANTAYRNFTVAQQGVDLVVRLRRSEDTFNGVPPFVVPSVFNNLDRHALVVSVKPGKLSISVDGTIRLNTVLPDNALDSWAREYRLALGNEITFDRPWLGVIREATVDVNGRQQDYLRHGALVIPSTYYEQLQLDRIHMIPFYPWPYSPNIQDWVVNFFGFMPLGFLLVVFYPCWSRVWRVTLICFWVSLAIETTQIFLPWRHPGIEDLILNTLGGAAGARAGIKNLKQRKQKSIAG